MSPWDKDNFRKHNKKLNNSQANKAAHIANAILKDTGDDAKAVRIANSMVKKKRGVIGGRNAR